MSTPNHPLGHCVLALTFGTAGNAAAFQSRGWSEAEAGFTWSCGKESLINLPVRCDVASEWLIVLEGHPYLHQPETSEQRVILNANGIEVFSFFVETTFRRVVRISGAQMKGKNLALGICYPNCDSPSRYGSDDTRLLGIAMHRLAVIEVSSARPPGSPLPWPASAPNNAQRLDALLLNSLISDDVTQVSTEIADVFPGFKVRLSIGVEMNTDFSVICCNMDAARCWTFDFSPAWRSLRKSNPAARMVVWHWLAILPLFVAYSFSNRIPGPVLLSLGDEAHGRGLAFCAQSSEAALIPDPYFMRSFGYKDLKKQMSETMIPFDQRKAVALWRGGTTGYREAEANIFTLPRVQLCILAGQTRVGSVVDAGFTNFVQVSQYEEGLLRDLGLVRDFVDPVHLVRWMFHIDIDGNTNSWPGLFQKLVSAGVVLRVTSKSNWRQWYYDRLEPNVNYVPIDANFHDLYHKVLYLTYNESMSQEIGLRGSLLAQSMTYEAEIDLAMRIFEDAIGQETIHLIVDHS